MEKIKVLVVEDEAPIQELLQFNLERSKYRVKVVDTEGRGVKRGDGRFAGCDQLNGKRLVVRSVTRQII